MTPSRPRGLSRQRETATAAYAAASDALLQLAVQARQAAKAADRSHAPDFDYLRALWHRCLAAEESLDFALLDLRTAAGEDA